MIRSTERPPYTILVDHEEDPNGYAGVRGTVETELSLGFPMYLTLADPWGHTWSAQAGDKPECGRNGFGWLVSHPGDYTLTLRQYPLQQSFPLTVRGGEMAVVTLRLAAAEEPPPPPASTGPVTLTEEQFTTLLAKLDDIILRLTKHTAQQEQGEVPC